MISRSGRQYREDVSKVVWLSKSIPTPQSGKLAVALVAHPPDIRRRDLDNLLKASLDSLTHAGVWVDDSQIKALSIEWGNVVAGGRLDVVVSFFKEDDK
jgi:crossover junction endodeoxyribonuclease RusA